MSEERMAILRMLEQGKITAEEAERLLRAMGSEDAQEKDRFGELGKSINQTMQEVGRVIGEAVGAAQRSTAGRAFSEVVGEVVSEFSGAGEEVEEEQEWTLDGAGVAWLKADTDSGAISAEGADQEQIEVRAFKKVRARTQQQAEDLAGRVEVKVERQGDEVRVYKEGPRPPVGVRVEVRYQIRCPRQVALRLNTLNGKIAVAGMRAGVEAATLNGSAEVEGGEGFVNLRSKNGRIAARIDRLVGKGEFETANGKVEVEIRAGQAPVEARTLNGSVEVTLPADFAGQLDARTTHGQVRSEFPITVSGELEKNHLEGPIGTGGETLVRLRTLNGAIALKKAPASG